MGKDLQESAYEALQRTYCEFEVGDILEMVRLPFTGDAPFGRYQPSFWNYDLGKCFIVDHVTARAIHCKGSQGNLPFYCFKLVKKARPKPEPIFIGSNEVHFKDDGIKVCGEFVSTEKIQQILERLKKQKDC